MKFNSQVEELKTKYNIIGLVDLDTWHTMPYIEAQRWLTDTVKQLWKSEYAVTDRLLFLQQQADVYVKNSALGLILKNLQIAINKQDISNFFVIILSNNSDIEQQIDQATLVSTDPVRISAVYYNEGTYVATVMDHHPADNQEIYHYGSVDPLKINLSSLTDRERFLLTESKTFCMYPWIHLHAYPTGEAYPCCHAEMGVGQVGNCKENTLKEIWNGPRERKLRLDMLTETPNPTCGRCYEQEESGFFSGRRSSNKHHGHHIERVHSTQSDGTVEQFGMTYWDIRFSNLCNLSCRSCGHIFSSSWFQDQVKLAGPEYAKTHHVLNIAGRTQTDMWEQLVPHLDYVDQIYFAGGEPLMMEEHYRILDELERRGRFDVRLAYNTNFTQTRLKDRTVFDYWKKFKNISVGASLDAMGPRGEYIRKGTNWDQIERNRAQMLEICPKVDFYISPTLSILNALHLPDFHRAWVDKGFIKPQDVNVNILQDPRYYRVDIAPTAYKDQIIKKYQEHIEWLRPHDPLQRATVGFESAINYILATDNTEFIPKFWSKTQELDQIRNENLLDVIPELQAIQ
jgi:MoaA/NifB/PqqE/SkfB family radical SAM enzyme